MVMLFIYSWAIYQFGFSKSFKAFFNYQNGINADFDKENSAHSN